MSGGNGRGLTTLEDFVDHYAVLGLPSDEEGSKLSLKKIEKAFRNQSLLRHPDKRPDDPNATADFQLLTFSFNVLRDEKKRSEFDAKLRARIGCILRDSLRDEKRRKLATDLNDRERSAMAEVDPDDVARRKERMMADELKKELAERRSKRASISQPIRAQQNKEEFSANLDKGRILKVTWEISVGDYNVTQLRGIFEKFGIVEDVVIRSNSSKKKFTAIIVMASKEAMIRALQSMSGRIENPLLVLPYEPIAPIFSSTSSTNRQENMGHEFRNVYGAGFEDYEASVMKKLREAIEKKKGS